MPSSQSSDTPAASKTPTGTVFDIQRFSIHDGPGIRTTVFLKGCPLQCFWCHNPEGIAGGRELSFQPERCIGCGACLEICSRCAHALTAEGAHVLDRERCEVCGACTAKCYARALEMVGREMSVEDVVGEVRRDLPFYETSGGGMTLSGGEPLEQYEFCLALLREAKLAGLQNCLDTSGLAAADRILGTLPYVDLYLFDIKDTDPTRHRAHTGVGNELILANLRRLHAEGASIRLRVPLIPGVNDRQENFQGIARLAAELANLEGVELMPYHGLGAGKLTRLGRPEDLRSVEIPEAGTVNAWIDRLAGLGVYVTNERLPDAAARSQSSRPPHRRRESR